MKNSISSSTSLRQNEPSSVSEDGRLDGMTILQFAHATKGGGGQEQHLKLLNRILLERNKMTIIQMYSVTNIEKLDVEIEKIGQGKLIWIPMVERQLENERSPRNSVKGVLYKLMNADRIKSYIINSPIYSIYFKIFRRKKTKYGTVWHENSGKKAKELFHRYNIDLVMLHSISNSDSAEIIKEAKENRIPYAIQHHFDNIGLKHPVIREKVLHAAGVGGVSRIGVPRYLKHRFINLSNGIDTEFFKPDNAKPLNFIFEEPIVILPARIVPGKGHIDLIHAATRLKREGFKIKVVFAGRQDSPQFEEELKELINQLMITDGVMFVGQLSLKDLRDWYAVSKIVVLPSYTEGLGRVLLEAQAMKIPPVAYNVGGVSEALKDGETGFIVKRGNVRELAARLKEILTDDYRRIQMGEAGRKFVEEKFSLIDIVKRYEDFYLDAILCRQK